jgi:hypothetical protein
MPAFSPELLPEPSRPRKELPSRPGRFPQQGKGFQGGSHRRRGQSSRKNVGPGFIDDELDHSFRADHKSSHTPQRFAQGTYPHGHSLKKLSILCQTPTLHPENPKGMSFVDHEHQVKFFRQFDKLRQSSQISFNAKNGIGHYQGSAVPSPFLQLALEILQVFMREEADIGSRESTPIPNGGMIGLVAKHDIPGAYKGADHPNIGGVTRGKD